MLRRRILDPLKGEIPSVRRKLDVEHSRTLLDRDRLQGDRLAVPPLRVGDLAIALSLRDRLNQLELLVAQPLLLLSGLFLFGPRARHLSR